jgi:hypothetical protein
VAELDGRRGRLATPARAAPVRADRQARPVPRRRSRLHRRNIPEFSLQQAVASAPVKSPLEFSLKILVNSCAT